MKKLTLIISTFFIFTMFANDADKCLGIWLTEDKSAKVEIYKKGEKYFGKLIWLKEPNNEKGKPKVDDKNPDDKLKSRPIWGLEFVWGFEYDGEDTWEDGNIYDPKSGKTYSAEFTIENNDTMKLRGYVGFTWIGRTSTWTRVK